MTDAVAAPTSKHAPVIAGAVGSVVEWYDFAVYGFFAASIGRLFFPSHVEIVSLLSAFAVFAVGFAARPVGSLLFGYLGDRFGRRPYFPLVSRGAEKARNNADTQDRIDIVSSRSFFRNI